MDVTGTEEDIQQGLEFVSTFDVTINETGKGLTRDEQRCTHCGACVPHCPTGALHISETVTRQVDYDEYECFECLGCIEVCPYAACSSAF